MKKVTLSPFQKKSNPYRLLPKREQLKFSKLKEKTIKENSEETDKMKMNSLNAKFKEPSPGILPADLSLKNTDPKI